MDHNNNIVLETLNCVAAPKYMRFETMGPDPVGCAFDGHYNPGNTYSYGTPVKQKSQCARPAYNQCATTPPISHLAPHQHHHRSHTSSGRVPRSTPMRTQVSSVPQTIFAGQSMPEPIQSPPLVQNQHFRHQYHNHQSPYMEDPQYQRSHCNKTVLSGHHTAASSTQQSSFDASTDKKSVNNDFIKRVISEDDGRNKSVPQYKPQASIVSNHDYDQQKSVPMEYASEYRKMRGEKRSKMESSVDVHYYSRTAVEEDMQSLMSGLHLNDNAVNTSVNGGGGESTTFHTPTQENDNTGSDEGYYGEGPSLPPEGEEEFITQSSDSY